MYMLQRPLISTLFPYTTLFRSIAAETSGGIERQSAGAGQQRCVLGEGGDAPVRRHPRDATRTVGRRPERGQIGVGDIEILAPDRKSTRLNSSHRTISYAVFCLK